MKKTTNRGFQYHEFKDLYGAIYSIQESSLATEEAIWIGIDDADPKIMASVAKAYGIETDETTGWVDYPIPNEVLLTTRMHLNRKQVKKLFFYFAQDNLI
jgi:hypothetical protein